ncbi:MAG: biotin transporter BioY [Archaeoglobaceae archaeon]
MVNSPVKLTLAIAMAAVTAISAQISFKVGPIPYTMQNFGVMLSGFLLGPRYGTFSILIYVGMIALGLPFASGGGGLGVLLGPTAGFIYGFIFSAFLAGVFRDFIGDKKLLLWISTLIASIPTYLFGFIVFYPFAFNDLSMLESVSKIAKNLGFEGSEIFLIFAATVLIFIPQDFLVDHLLAVVVYFYLKKMLTERGMEL